MKQKHAIQFWILMGAIPTFLLIFYRKVVLSPNRFLFEDRGDAIKNYFTYASQIRSDNLLEGHFINYPYGEHFLYLDCHPLLTVVLHYLDALFPWIVPFHIGILNFLMIISLPLSAVFIYLILTSLKVDKWWSLFGALALMIMSPQLFRMTGHFALSYALFIPMTWYIYIRFCKSSRIYTWSLVMAVNILFWFFVHAYLGMIALSFILLNLILDFFLVRRNTISLTEKLSAIFIQTIAPASAFFFFLKFTDHHVGRTDNPWGFFVNSATFESVFLPHHAPLKPVFTSLFEIKNQSWGGWSYIGITSIIMMLCFIIGFMTRKSKPDLLISRANIAVLRNKYMTTALLSGTILLLFSMAYPFRWGMEFLLDWFPLIKKFRGTGRFAWVFYYTVGIGSVFMLDFIYEAYKGRFRWIMRIGVILLLGAYIWEGYPWHREISNQISTKLNYLSQEYLPSEYKKSLDVIFEDNYQAIIPLPFFNKGSENFSVEGTDKIYKLTMVLAYHSDTPILGSYSTHTSIPEAKNIMQILSPVYYNKEIGHDIHTYEDFLIIYSKENLNQYERNLLDKGKMILDEKDFSIYALSYPDLFNSTAPLEISEFTKLKNQNQLRPFEGFMVTDTSGPVLYDSYDDQATSIYLEGEGAFMGRFKDFNLLYQIPPDKLEKGKEYNVSFWMYNGGTNYGQDALNSTVFVQEKSASKVDWISLTNPSNSMVINGMWSLVELTFIPKGSDYQYALCLKGDDRLDKAFYMDELLIREKGNLVYKVLDKHNGQITKLLKNNQRIVLE